MHLAARGQDGRRLAHKGQQPEQGFLPRRRLRLLKQALRHHQGDHPHPRQPVPRLDSGVAMPGGDDDIPDAVDGAQPFLIHLEQAGKLGGELDLAFLHLAPVHARPLGNGA